MYKQSILVVFVSAFLLACAGQPAPGSPESRLQEVAQEKEIASKRLVEEVSNAPDWVREKPQSDAAMYSTGFATQPAMDLAQRAADAILSIDGGQGVAQLICDMFMMAENFNEKSSSGAFESLAIKDPFKANIH